MVIGNSEITTVKLSFQCGYAQDNFAKASASDNSVDIKIKAGSGDNGFEDMQLDNVGDIPERGHPLYVTWDITES
ncbi:hypothetical protein [Pseudoalteromonas luteoviolacea]|uniref:Uncharacterized protein n=1 Tax=Pseudoalteromonas luteoviolacea S4054 TaxID=1129367 RepID=A0A0F6AD56_9GAMM|nr:hypothetical protein S4054249_10385 [Pseudoalteromonas luteoviolacea]AOT13136.1 hypothetical protein S40542_10360 [Pseudoalteromonas luteoviolacea]AOT18048.1 hypothetical protein S4054_10355 [Pseudoalteromonas luteoviolacea]KKE84152.1 hypothetical protein N479_09640 [Pseudoalteromonas luteoviolacea S4054]KZN76243.1 hypothetical protein N481_07775 [Pseudoalteromonas luteoviolacea S4047-1]